MRDTLEGIRYAWNNRTIRGLIFGIGTLNFASGILTIVIPLLMLNRLQASEIVVGIAFAISGVAGVASTLAFGRIDSRGIEWRMLVYPMVFMVPGYALLLLANSAPAVAVPAIGLLLIGVTMLIFGLMNGPLDIGLFTIRQRRTDTAMMGRAFAISMALNFSGFPVGAVVAGLLAERSLDLAIVAAVVACAIAVLLTAVMVPKTESQERILSEPGLDNSA